MTGVIFTYSNSRSLQMKRKMLFVAIIILAFAALGAVSLGILLKNNGTSTQNSQSGSTDNQSNQTATQNSHERLLVTGLVQHPLNLTLDEIVALPKSTINAALYCVDYPISPLASGNWTGVRLAYLLQQAEVGQTAVKVAFYANDGYTTDLTVQAAMSNDILVAYQLNGKPISEQLRLVVPGRFGYKWISHLTAIELVDYDFKGKWEGMGYSDEGLIP
jgi:DMSO/TMAO reductase YedYZ molybdopterin-dependent catalytic subunit